MGKVTGFKEFERKDPLPIEPHLRVHNYNEFLVQLPTAELRSQGARCMDCGVPFCHAGCPLGNLIPDWNDLVYKDDWERASEYLHRTNNFPEFTGKTCPAPCEESCVLAISEPAVSIKNIESAIVERAFEEGWVVPRVPKMRTGKRVAVVGSGPAGLACAQQLNKVGHKVTVFERADRIGGLLRYGIPDFKMEKWVIDRRLEVLEAEGIAFKTGIEIGVDIDKQTLLDAFDAVVLCTGSTRPRELKIPGADLDGVHYAMDFLSQQNRRVAGDRESYLEHAWWFGDVRADILANDKHVIVIGGGDTGADCVGTSNRQGAKSITQFEYKPTPSGGRAEDQPWPFWPMRLRNGSSHEEGCNRQWSILTKELRGTAGKVEELVTVEVEWVGRGSGQRGEMIEVPGTETHWPADLVLLSMGFSGVEQRGVVSDFGVELNTSRAIASDENHQSSVEGVFACGDARIGQSLVVTAISEGREVARSVDEFMMGTTRLPTKGHGDLPQYRY